MQRRLKLLARLACTSRRRHSRRRAMGPRRKTPMDTAIATARWAKLALTFAGIIAAIVLGVATRIGLDMASYFETETVLARDGGATGAATPASPHAPAGVVPIVAAGTPAVEVLNDDAADLQHSTPKAATVP